MAYRPDTWQLDVEQPIDGADSARFNADKPRPSGKPTLVISHDGQPLLTALRVDELQYGRDLRKLFAIANEEAPRLRSQVEALEAIVREIAAEDPRYANAWLIDVGDCILCGFSRDHAEDCVWRRAVEWVQAHPKVASRSGE